MKKTVIMLTAAAVIAGLSIVTSCGQVYKKGDRMPDATSEQIDTISYALGMYYGKMLTSTPFGEINLSELKKGFNDVISEKETMLDENELNLRIQSYIQRRYAFESERNKTEGEEFLAANKEKEGVVETESGLQYKIEREGTGISPEMADTVEVNYEGCLLDGTVFDSSYERGKSAVFPLSGVIKGWAEGLTYAKEGGEITLYLPSDLAYGQYGSGPIPANSLLIFKVELIKVMKAAPEETDDNAGNDK
ncbi:MAG TPA: FKBP-type peptidyl-prolyl cis-trans isomerase [Candidatus Coprenecus pullistercoris]|nr:FKBP-type peptidyl-prolyl cis-trans isomerase [Candidatus Coprenecus pullistercoris]